MKSIYVKIDDVRHNVDDLTLDECIAVEREAGVTWWDINPTASAVQAKAIIGAVALRLGKTELVDKLGSMTLAQILELIDIADDDLPTEFEDGIPKEAAEPETS